MIEGKMFMTEGMYRERNVLPVAAKKKQIMAILGGIPMRIFVVATLAIEVLSPEHMTIQERKEEIYCSRSTMKMLESAKMSVSRGAMFSIDNLYTSLPQE